MTLRNSDRGLFAFGIASLIAANGPSELALFLAIFWGALAAYLLVLNETE